MELKELILQKNISIYELSHVTHIPYSTLSDLVKGTTPIHKCSCEKVYRLAKALNVSMESLIKDSMLKEMQEIHKELADFDVFRSNIAHQIKSQGDLEFIYTILSEKTIDKLYEQQEYTKSVYLLATIDYLSRINNIPLCTAYNHLRNVKLPSPVIPLSIRIQSSYPSGKSYLKKAKDNAIPEFIRHNIIEGNIRDVA